MLKMWTWFFKFSPLISAAMVGAVLTLITVLPTMVEKFEKSHKRWSICLGAIMGIIVAMGAVSAYQQQDNAATKDDLKAMATKTDLANLESVYFGGDSVPFLRAIDIGNDEINVVNAIQGSIPLTITAEEIRVTSGTIDILDIIPGLRISKSGPSDLIMQGAVGLVRPGHNPVTRKLSLVRGGPILLRGGFQATNGYGSSEMTIFKSAGKWHSKTKWEYTMSDGRKVTGRDP